MSVFQSYASVYDAIYADKPYGDEIAYVLRLIEKHVSRPRTLLDLGCGTGRHLMEFARAGIDAHGVERSGPMLDIARYGLQRCDEPTRSRIRFIQSDIRDLRLPERFDAVVSLFHVMSYLTGNADLEAGLRTVAEHLNPGGIFVFDFWYGPAVLLERPAVRVKRIEIPPQTIVRIAEPTLREADCVVDIDYELLVTDERRHVTRLQERHSMRYFFIPEVRMLLERYGFEALDFLDWMEESAPRPTSWAACCVARKS